MKIQKQLCMALCGAAFLMSASLPIAAQNANSQDFIRTSRTANFDTDFTTAAEKTVNTVVCIKSFVTPRSSSSNGFYQNPFDMFEFFFGPQQQQRQQQQPRSKQRNSEPVQNGLGSGVILTEDGYIVTNNHVIAQAEKLEVLLNDNSTYQAKIIGTDEATDLALIKIDATGLSPIVFGNSDDLKIGEWVLAVGNPFGFNSTVTAGIVSAKSRSLGDNNRKSLNSIESFIQTDAALNPGNSGGALVNLRGELVGINSAIYSNTGSYTGFSFAIPTSIVSKVMADLKEYGTVQRAVLGCTIRELDSALAEEKEITAVKAGLLVDEVNDRSTAKELGLQKDDVITAINGVEIHTTAQIHEQLSKCRPGDNISLTYYRDNKKYTKSGVLRNPQGNTAVTKKGDFSDLGCAFMKISDELKRNLGISNGVQVTGIKGGPFSEQGVKDGFVIVEINDTPVSNSDDVERIYNALMKDEKADKVMFITGYYPTGKKYYYAINLSQD